MTDGRMNTVSPLEIQHHQEAFSSCELVQTSLTDQLLQRFLLLETFPVRGRLYFSLTPYFIPHSWRVTSPCKETFLQCATMLLITLFIRQRLENSHLLCLLLGAAS